jgi:hypothetical protein
MVVLVVAPISCRSADATNDTGFKRDGVLLAAYDLNGRSQDVSPRPFRELRRGFSTGSSEPSVESAALAHPSRSTSTGCHQRSHARGHARSDGAGIGR